MASSTKVPRTSGDMSLTMQLFREKKSLYRSRLTAAVFES
jgi:hypothetical protein